ncbi:OOP family OmpA-OmpF porin [Catalinimonas alkaloidigena]|uniref:OmpA family protein n=1 Tax=Catalinimonas alkaloidigena TaxID=1075417 RepID=UPI00240671ED|nr:OmpA family protein [Catalinimonas alkaloidigena]MDF9796778.1 OOP family OmpA-OmpF porin [Catalinimonas alkaloidigena]
MKNGQILLVLVFLLMGQVLLAQRTQEYTTNSKKAIKYYVESTNYFIRRQYGPALELLSAAVRKDGGFAEAHLRMSKIFKSMGDENNMKHHLQKVVKSEYNNPKFSEAHVLLAEIYFEIGEYDEAEELAQHVINLKNAHKLMQDDARYLLTNIKFTQENINKPVDFQPKVVTGGVNQLGLQYFPVLTVDQKSMIFTGRRGSRPQYDEDIYISKKQDDGQWSKPELLSDNINTRANEGTCTISADGRTLIYTACQDRSGFGSCDLYISYKIGDEWTMPKNLGNQVNASSWESQPSLSADGNTLYFVSDRKGGIGRRDIYVTYRNEEGDWCKAVNLGKEINTPRDEVSPFIHVNGQTLYFASDGLPGFGKFDLYVAEKNENSWSPPKNLGYPINTKEDQASLFITANGKDAYYSNENRQGDHYVSSLIYTFVIPEEIRVTNRSSYVEGIVYDAVTKKPLGATVELMDLNKQKKVADVNSDPKNGEYLMVLTEGSEYALYVDREGYLFQSLAFNYTVKGNTNLQEPKHIDIYLQPIAKGKETVLNNIFFDVDKYEIKEISKPELNKVVRFLEENSEISIAINGHTDNQGSADYNLELSAKRAKAVHDYLVDAGISEERLQSRGYGQSKPITSNDTEEGRQKNRRIAFEIL